jgi:hypothetical protein
LLEELEARTEAARPGFRAMNFLMTYGYLSRKQYFADGQA